MRIAASARKLSSQHLIWREGFNLRGSGKVLSVHCPALSGIVRLVSTKGERQNARALSQIDLRVVDEVTSPIEPTNGGTRCLVHYGQPGLWALTNQ